MTATVGSFNESDAGLTPLADYLGSVLRRLRARPALDLDLTQAHGNVLAENVLAPHPYPAFDQASIDGYAARSEDILGAGPGRPARLSVVGDLAASSWRPARLTAGTCFSVAAGAPLPVAADVVIPPEWTDQGMASVEVNHAAKRGYGIRRVGEIMPEGSVLGR